MKNFKNALAALTASALLAVTLGACGDSEKLGRTINSDGYSFQEVEGYPFVPTTGADDCDAEDYINRETDCGFPAGYAKKHKVKKSKTSKSQKSRKTSSVAPVAKSTPVKSAAVVKTPAPAKAAPVVKSAPAPAPVVKSAPAPVVKSAPAPAVKSAPATKRK